MPWRRLPDSSLCVQLAKYKHDTKRRIRVFILSLSFQGIAATFHVSAPFHRNWQCQNTDARPQAGVHRYYSFHKNTSMNGSAETDQARRRLVSPTRPKIPVHSAMMPLGSGVTLIWSICEPESWSPVMVIVWGAFLSATSHR